MSVAENMYDPFRKVSDLDDSEKLRILVVEDNAADAWLIENALANIPHVGNITHVNDGAQALQMIDSGYLAPDLAIIDLQMPHVDGFKLLVELGCRELNDFPKIVLTSSMARSDYVRSRLRGAARVFTKPDSLEELSALLTRTILNIKVNSEAEESA